MIRWEDHKHAIVGGKEKNREKKKVYQVGWLIERGENLKKKIGVVKERILENGTLLEQLEQITSPDITNALPLGRGREGWGESMLSPAPTNCDLLEQLEQVTAPRNAKDPKKLLQEKFCVGQFLPARRVPLHRRKF